MESKTVAGISVGVIVRNEAMRLSRCLEAIASQSDCGEGFEIIVIDNASRDSTVRVACDLKEKWSGRVDIRVIRLESNGLGVARNRALREARYDLIAFTDADCVVPSDWVKTLKGRFGSLRARQPEVVAIGTANVPPLGESSFHDALRLMFSSFLGHLNSPQAKSYAVEQIVTHIPTCSVLYDRQRVLNAGGFSNEFDSVCEDVELSCRLRASGYKLLMLPGSEVVHHHRESMLLWGRKIFRYGWGQVLVARRWKTHLSARLMLPPLFIASFIVASVAGAYWFAMIVSMYLASIAVAAGLACQRAKCWRLWGRLALLYSITHFAYGCGMAAGPILLVRNALAPSLDFIKVGSSREPFA